ncbi:MAG TPA: MFS transporter, partial [Polyangia bacterium]
MTRTDGGWTLLDMNRYQWTVLFAAWLGWGFDVFDGLLFNYVAPNCVPTLLGLPIGSVAAKAATLRWGGILTSMLLLGWAAGGILFGRIADRIGRKRTLLLTMLLYALGTAACAGAVNIWMLMVFRVVASLGIGGEWAAGAAMVAEVVPDKRRVEAGALLYTSAPAGLFLATFANAKIAGVIFHGSPETSWRFVFLCGLIPAAVAFIVRVFVREPERWSEAAAGGTHPRIAELFTPEHRRATLGGFAMAVVALITWWSVNAFISIVASGLARETAAASGLDHAATLTLVTSWTTRANNWFNVGGLLGTLLTIPAAKVMGRRAMFGIYYALSAVAVMTAFGLDLSPETRLTMYFFIGLTVFGVFGSFTYYLPELFPTRLRGTGAGFCYNVGRVVAAAGPFLVG